MISYRVKKKDKEVLNTVVVKEGMSVEFTLADLDRNLDQLAAQHREVEGQVKIHAAEMKNVELNHPEVLTVPKELRTYVHVYETFQEKFDNEKAFLDRVIEAEEKLKKEKEEIYKTIGIPMK